MTLFDIDSPALSRHDREFLASMRGLLLEQTSEYVTSAVRNYENIGLDEFQELCALCFVARQLYDVQNSEEMNSLMDYSYNAKSIDAINLREWWINVQHIDAIEHLNWRQVAGGLKRLVDEKLCSHRYPIIVGQAALSLRVSLLQMNLDSFKQDEGSVFKLYERIIRAMNENKRVVYQAQAANIPSDESPPTGDNKITAKSAGKGGKSFKGKGQQKGKGKGTGNHKGRTGEPPNLPCPLCNECGHWRSDCPKDPRNQCSHCKEPGHWRAQCPHLDKARSTAANAASTTTDSVENQGNDSAPAWQAGSA